MPHILVSKMSFLVSWTHPLQDVHNKYPLLLKMHAQDQSCLNPQMSCAIITSNHIDF